MSNKVDMKDLVALCKRRGFIFPASEIYGGINGFWDYGPLGTELKNNLRDYWWKSMVTTPPIGPDGQPLQIVGIDSAIIQNPRAWEASGHVGGFNDPMVDDKATKSRFRADHLKFFSFDTFDKDGEIVIDIAFDKDDDEEIIIKRLKGMDNKNPKGNLVQLYKDGNYETWNYERLHDNNVLKNTYAPN